MEILPEWEPGTTGVLSVAGLPHSIPISTAVRAGDDRLLFALSRRRHTLELLRDPRAGFCLLGPGFAFTAYGPASVIRHRLAAAPHVTALELRVDHIQDHLEGSRTEILDAVRWRWTADEAAEDERRILAELRELADAA